VALVCPYDWSHPGGVKTHISGLAVALAERGVDTEIIAPAASDIEGVFVAGRSLAVPANGSVARLCFSKSAKTRIVRRLAYGDIDVVHLHEPAIPSVSLLALMGTELPSIATFHASATRSAGYGIAKPVLARYLDRLKERIVVSGAARTLISRYFPGEYRVIPNGIDTRLYSDVEPDPFVASHSPSVLFVGRSEPRKGLSVAVSAMEKLKHELPDVSFVTVGPEPSELPAWGHALGAVDQVRLASIYKAADVFCAPSISGESFGIVLAEAMASGTPVVCSDLPGYVDAAAGAVVHVPAGDAIATAAALRLVLTDPEVGAELKAKGLARAAQLDWRTIVDDVIDCYQRAVS
jgi:phosphatidylinositol alpha-mannosyltransferase